MLGPLDRAATRVYLRAHSMREHLDLIDAYAKHCARSGNAGAVLATVVRVQGSAYRRPGARMLLDGGTWLAGAVSGGCLESDVAKKALWRTESGAAIVTYDATLDDDEITWGFGLGCNGVVDVLIERLSSGPTNPLIALERCVSERKTGVIATVLDGPELGRRTVAIADEQPHSTIESGELRAAVSVAVKEATSGRAIVQGTQVLVEVITPPTPLVIFGSGYDVVPVVRFAGQTGFHTTVVETLPRAATQQRFAHADRIVTAPPDALPSELLGPTTIALVMTHNILTDTELVKKLAPSPVRYLGVLGPKARTERILKELPGLTAAQRARIHAPVGLDIGAEGAEEIALAIVSEIRATLTGRAGGMLRDRTAPIHA